MKYLTIIEWIYLEHLLRTIEKNVHFRFSLWIRTIFPTIMALAFFFSMRRIVSKTWHAQYKKSWVLNNLCSNIICNV